MPASLIAAICAIAFVHANDGDAGWSAWMPPPRTSLCAACVVWLLFELRTAR